MQPGMVWAIAEPFATSLLSPPLTIVPVVTVTQFSGWFPKCTRQIKKGLACKCVAKTCKGCTVPAGGAVCLSPETCNKFVENVGRSFCDACRADCAQPSTCNRYIHGVHCVECGEFSDLETCRPCLRLKDVANQAVAGVRAAASAAMAWAIADAKSALQEAAPGESLALEVLQSATTKMAAKLEQDAQISNGLDGEVRDGEPAEDMPMSPLLRTAQGEDLNEILSQLKGNADISMAAVISLTLGLRQIASKVSQAANDSAGNTKELGDLSSAATKMVEASAKMQDVCDPGAVNTWIKEDCFARGFLARELLRDFVKQVARKEGLQMPKAPSESLVNEMVCNLSQEQIARLSKDLLAQVRASALDAETCAPLLLIGTLERYLLHSDPQSANRG